MTDPRVQRWVDVLTDYCTAIEPGFEVAIYGTALAEPLILELVRAARCTPGRWRRR